MPAKRELRRAMAVRKKAVVTDAMEAVGEGVEQKASNELVGSECHHLDLVVVAVVAPAKAHLIAGERDQPAVGDGDAMSVAAEIGQHLLGTGEGPLGKKPPNRCVVARPGCG